ncbi:MAG: hypothetical protein HYU36_04260 [Planctomycetes bacterium]|nr:hypothetical protein [Planctomycetota bacterium]
MSSERRDRHPSGAQERFGYAHDARGSSPPHLPSPLTRSRAVPTLPNGMSSERRDRHPSGAQERFGYAHDVRAAGRHACPPLRLTMRLRARQWPWE